MPDHITCPICGTGQLHPRLGTQHLEHLGHPGRAPLHYHQCDFCGAEQASAQDLSESQKAAQAFYARVDEMRGMNRPGNQEHDPTIG